MITINKLIANSINITTGPKLDEPLCFTAKEAGSTVGMEVASEAAPEVSLEYSTDGNTWSPFVVSKKGVEGTTVTLANVDDKMWVRATSAGNTKMGSSSIDYNKFVMTGKISASGNVNTLLDQNGNATITSYCYSYLFTLCSSLTTAPELPATTLSDGCYYGMFSVCEALTKAPELPATTLAARCYQNMFNGCSSLTTAPSILPATTLADYCYNYMFNGCSNLNTIKLGYTGSFSNTYFKNWVYNVAETGTFYYNGTDTKTGISAIPTRWTVTPFTS